MALLYIGYGRKDFTLSLPFPMAGITTFKQRLAGWQRDPLGATAVVFRRGGRKLALIGMDLLIINEELNRKIADGAAALGISGVFINASHTHSSLGGYVERPWASYFMGGFQESYRQLIVDAALAAMEEALGKMSRVESLVRGAATVPGLTMNRRVTAGATDDRVAAVLARRKKGRPVLIYSAAGHPVSAAFIQPDAASADVPGAATAGLADKGYAPLFLSGPLGGLNLLFPESTTKLETHLALVGGLIRRGVEDALAAAVPVAEPALDFEVKSLDFELAFPPLVRPDLKVAALTLISSGVGHLYSRLLAYSGMSAPVTVLRLGDVTFVGMPADFGVVAALDLRDRLTDQGNHFSIVTSHTNGYAGYTHLPHEYEWTPDAEREVFLYENAMSWFGPEVAARLNEAALELCRKPVR